MDFVVVATVNCFPAMDASLREKKNNLLDYCRVHLKSFLKSLQPNKNNCISDVEEQLSDGWSKGDQEVR